YGFSGYESRSQRECQTSWKLERASHCRHTAKQGAFAILKINTKQLSTFYRYIKEKIYENNERT
ncbi:MAG: hypothetical protein J0651_04760, partial [Actinobacteria bacterium]|nr:hypothetical protein [Actinomycetota bacterium]